MFTAASLVALSLMGASTLAGGSAPAAAQRVETARAAEPNYASIMADRSPAMALIKFILTVDAGGQSQDIEGEAMAVMIDPKGLLVMCGAEIGQAKGMSATPKELKVCIGDDTEGVLAKLVGRDSELDLAWLRIEKPADKGYSAIDPSKAATPKVGDTLVGLERMGKYFDRAPVVFTTMVGGITKKPRELFIPSPGGSTQFMFIGTPYFSAGGEFVGLSVIQRPNADSEDGMNSRVRERLTRFDQGFKILPAAEIVSATARAVEAEKAGKGVGMDEAKPEEKKDAAPADKKDEPKKEPVKKD
jgi:S1-C subfamily serine protease